MERTLAEEFEIDLGHLLEEINLKYSYDFRNYSSASMNRRVHQAMVKMGFNSLPSLMHKILHDSNSFDNLLQYLTVPVSEMFRDPHYYQSLREKVIPHLKTYPSLKIWIAGCSTGEEAYSLAILLQEENLLERTILYATDINSRSLESAEKGIFALDELSKFNQNYVNSGGKRLLSDYYTANLKSVKFDSGLKKNISFSNHSLVSDAVFSEMNFISCRNVLIYFNRELQDRAFGLFYDSLCRKGFLGLGSKETIQFSQYAKNFDLILKADRIFQKNSNPSPPKKTF